MIETLRNKNVCRIERPGELTPGIGPCRNDLRMSAPGPAPKAFDAVVEESIDTVLTQLLGKIVTDAIYDYIERNYSLTKDELTQNSDKLFLVLGTLFGDKGRRVVSRYMAKHLFRNLDLRFEPVEGFEFLNYVEKARSQLEAKELE